MRHRQPDPPAVKPDRAAKARVVHQRNAAVRALDDPATVARAARIIKEALRRQRLTLADITPDTDTGEAA